MESSFSKKNDHFQKKWHQLSRAPVAAWVSTIRRESTREESAESFSRQECKARMYRSGEGGEKSLLCDPGSELRLLRSHAGHFCCVFSLIIIIYLFCLFFLSRSYTNSSIFILAVGNTPYGKRRNSRTESPFWWQSNWEESLHLRQSFCTTARSIRHNLQPEKHRRNERYTW